MYRWCAEAADGLRIDYPVEGEGISEVLADLLNRVELYDLILVDSWHTYDSSLRDMRLALSVLKEEGVLVVHDCLPPSAVLVEPSYVVGDWCGETYAAMIDFVAGDPALDVYTVDADFGCAMIRRRPAAGLPAGPTRPDPIALAGWGVGDPADRFRYFEAHSAGLLNLVSIEEFLVREGLVPFQRRRRGRWEKVREYLFLICSSL